jgi:hypothetical protein
MNDSVGVAMHSINYELACGTTSPIWIDFHAQKRGITGLGHLANLKR